MENITWIQRRGQIKHLLYEMCLTGRIDRATLAEQFKDLNSVAPVKHGRWIYDDEAYPGGNPYGHYECDQCGESAPHKTNYCPNCGARMDEVEE